LEKLHVGLLTDAAAREASDTEPMLQMADAF
jgi:hypothetical protein